MTIALISPLTDLPTPPSDKTGWPWYEASPPLPPTMPNGRPWPKISIVTPSYNQGQFIEETIRSVLLQGYPNLEYIIMDGGSTDNSLAIIDKYRPWLDHVRVGPDGGQAAAIGEGFRLATGEILAWLNSDDRYRPSAFARVARFFAEHPRVCFGNGDVFFIDVDGVPTQRAFALPVSRLLTENLGIHGWPQQGCFWRRSTYLLAGGMDPSFQFCMDLDLFVRLVRTGPARRIEGPPLADFRRHPSAKTSTLEKVQYAEEQKIVAKYGNPYFKFKRSGIVLEAVKAVWLLHAKIRRHALMRFGLEL